MVVNILEVNIIRTAQSVVGTANSQLKYLPLCTRVWEEVSLCEGIVVHRASPVTFAVGEGVESCMNQDTLCSSVRNLLILS